ncbi:MAG: hypothetical protein HY242_09080 [Afipia sp.]|nr:hypothetical protein [Afipia sp.]
MTSTPVDPRRTGVQQSLPSPRIRRALELMVLEGHDRKQAAQAVQMRDKSLANALREPRVKAFYNGLLEVLRLSVRAKNFHRLNDIAADSKNDMARVNAIKTMEQISDTAPPAQGPITRPGLIFVIQQPAGMIDVTPSAPAQGEEPSTD